MMETTSPDVLARQSELDQRLAELKAKEAALSAQMAHTLGQGVDDPAAYAESLRLRADREYVEKAIAAIAAAVAKQRAANERAALRKAVAEHRAAAGDIEAKLAPLRRQLEDIESEKKSLEGLLRMHTTQAIAAANQLEQKFLNPERRAAHFRSLPIDERNRLPKDMLAYIQEAAPFQGAS
jgi:chromosome segregation ATPase